MTPDRFRSNFQVKAVVMPMIIMAIAVAVLTGCCQTFTSNNGPKPEAKIDHEKVTKAKTLLSPARAMTKTIAVTLRVPILAKL